METVIPSANVHENMCYAWKMRENARKATRHEKNATLKVEVLIVVTAGYRSIIYFDTEELVSRDLNSSIG